MKCRFHSILAITLCAVFLFYKYILQNFPIVMSQQLMAAFELKGLGLGILSGAYFWTYLIVPLFAGILLDRYGVRWMTTIAILFCALGMYFFYIASSLKLAIWSRALVGVGVSFATVAFLKLASMLFDKKYYALLTSYLVVSGMIGAICGQAPLAWLIKVVGWRESLLSMSLMGLVLAIHFVYFVRDKTDNSLTQTSHNVHIWHEMFQIFKSRQNWLLTGYS